MSKKDELTKKQKEELRRLADELSNLSIGVVEDYESNPSEISGSLTQITQVHEDSPFLDAVFDGDKWKRVIKNIPEVPENLKEDNDTE